MKKLSALLFFFILIATYAHAQCNEFYQFESGTAWELETYNGKGKLNGKNHQKVTGYEKTSSGFKATINSVLFNEKDKELAKGDVAMTCDGGTILLDMRNFITEDQLKAYDSYEVKVESNALEIPNKLSIGQSLKDGSITITATNSPLPMKMIVNIINRKVEAKESVTTPAGTFECYKISSTLNLQNQIGVNINFTFSSIEWIAAKVGTVKSESYNKNGKLQGYTILTKRT